jgi:hypothetical protein
MNKQESGPRFFTNDARAVLRRPSSIIVGALAATGIMLAGCATAGERGDSPRKPPHQRDVPTFGEGTIKELSFGNKRLTMVVAVDEDGKIQEFRAPGTKFFSVRDLDKQPLKAGSIASFESLSIIKTTNPKICWPRGDGAVCCVEW